VSASYAYTASSAILASASLIATSASYSYTASSAINASASLVSISSSYAQTASFANNFTASNILVTGTLTAQTLVVQTVTASQEYSSGSNVFGNSLTNTQVFTGSVSITGSLSVNSIPVVLSNQTGSMSVLSASYAYTASSAISAYTASSAISSSFSITSNVAYSGTGSFTGSFIGAHTGSLFGTASIATSASYTQLAATSSNIQGGTANYLALWSGSTQLSASSIYQTASTVIINQTGYTTANPEALYVWQSSSSSFNVISGKGNLNNYLQLNIQNTNAGNTVSSDIVATANNGDENGNYIDIGINGQNFNGTVGFGPGGPNDAYLYNTGSNLYIGNYSPNQSLFLFNGYQGDHSSSFQIAPNLNIYISSSLTVTGSINAIAGVTGSLFGTASYAIRSISSSLATSSSYAYTASSAILASASLVATSASYAFTASSAISSSYAYTASSAINASASLISISSSYSYTASSAISSSYALTASYALNAAAASSFPYTGSAIISGSLTVTGSIIATLGFSGSLFGTSSQAISASYAYTASSAISSSWSVNSIVTASVLNTTITFTKGDGSTFNVTVSQSGSVATASYALTAATASYVLNAISSSYSYTASSAISASYTFTASSAISSSYSYTASSAISSSLSQTASYVVTAQTASYVLNTISASFSSTASYLNPLNQTVTLTGSFNVTGSTIQIGNNTLIGNTILSGSIIISGSSSPGSLTSSIKIYGNIDTNGYVRFNPITTNIDTTVSASYIYVSGSTQDLYFSQNSAGYANTTRLRWLEGNLYTGLLNGGIISQSSSTVYTVSSGSGIFVSLNASTGSNPYPIITYINWPTLSASIAPLSASFDQSFVSITSAGTINTQGIPYNDGQFNTLIPIGLVLHQNHSTINGVKTQPSLAYGYKQRVSVFTQAFGPLKLSGFNLLVSGSSTGSLIVSAGTSYDDGTNYPIDPNNPSYIQDSGTNVSKIWRYYQSGSGTNNWVYNTNAGSGFTTIDPTQYSNNGVLTSVPGNGSNRNWSIQRCYWFPNSVSKAIVVYYGNAVYPDQGTALANLNIETFTEAPNTQANAVYLGALLVQNNANFTNTATYVIVPSGLFRSIGGSGGGGGTITQTLNGLSDVNVTDGISIDGNPLTYSDSLGVWVAGTYLSASISGNATTATTASYALTASYVLNAISSSYAYTASSAISSSYAFTASSAINASASLVAISSSYAYTASSATNASASLISISSSYSYTASFAISASFANTSSVAYSGTGSFTGSFIGIHTGSLFGTSSQAISSSYAYTASSAINSSASLIAISSSYAYTASSAIVASASLIATSASYAFTASSAILASSSLIAVSSSYAQTASFANNFTASNIVVTGTLIAQTLIVQTVSASQEYSSGSNIFGNSLTNTQVMTGSVSITGSLTVNGSTAILTNQTGSMNVLSSSYAFTASSAISSSYSYTASSAISSSYAFTASSTISSSYSYTASSAINASASLISISSSYAQTSSYGISSISSSYAQTSSYANATATNPYTIGGNAIYYSTVNTSIVGANNMFTLATGSFTSGFFKYTVYTGSNARAGEVFASWINGAIQYTDFSTPDNGLTTQVTMSVAIVTSQLQFNVQTNTSGWTIKSQATLM